MTTRLTVPMFAAGVALVTAGTTIVYWPAGLIVAGLCLIVVSWPS